MSAKDLNNYNVYTTRQINSNDRNQNLNFRTNNLNSENIQIDNNNQI